MTNRLISMMCSYCRKFMGERVSEPYEGSVAVSHGCCAECMAFAAFEWSHLPKDLPPGKTVFEFMVWKTKVDGIRKDVLEQMRRKEAKCQ